MSKSLVGSPVDESLASLRQWLANGHGPWPSLADFPRVRGLAVDALELIVAYAPGPGLRVLPGTLDWHAAYGQASARVRDLGRVLGVLTATDLRPFAAWRKVELPEALVERAVASLSFAHDLAEPSSSDTLAMARPRSDDAAWVVRWRRAVGADLLWHAVTALASGDRTLLSHLDRTHAVEAVEAIVAGRPPAIGQVIRLAQMIPHAERHEPVEWLIAKAIDNGHCLVALTLAERAPAVVGEAQRELALMVHLDDDKILSWSAFPQFARTLAADLVAARQARRQSEGRAAPAEERATQWTELSERGRSTQLTVLDPSGESDALTDTQLRCVLFGWPHIDARSKSVLRTLAGPAIGQPWADLLLGWTRAVPDPPHEKMGQHVFVQQIQAEPKRAQTALPHLWGRLPPEGPMPPTTANLIRQRAPELTAAALSEVPTLEVARKLLAGAPCIELPAISDDDRSRLRSFLGACPPYPPIDASGLLRCGQGPEDALDRLRLLPPGVKVILEPERLADILQAVLTDDALAVEWRRLIRRLRLELQVGWRLLMMSESFDLDQLEHRAIAQLDPACVLRLFMRGTRLDVATVETIEHHQLVHDPALDTGAAAWMAEHAVAVGAGTFARRLAQLAIDRAAQRDGRDRKAVIDDVTRLLRNPHLASLTALLHRHHQQPTWVDVARRALAYDLGPDAVYR